MPRTGVPVKYLTSFLLSVCVVLGLGTPVQAQGGYTAEQQNVIRLIYEACDRWQVDCTIPLAVARRESNFNPYARGDWDVNLGYYHSMGPYQFHNWGQGANGPYYWQYGLDWRLNVWMNVDRGVYLTTLHLRGGFDYLNCTCGWWTPKGLDTRNLPPRPGFIGGGGPVEPTPDPTPDPTPEPTSEPTPEPTSPPRPMGGPVEVE